MVTNLLPRKPGRPRLTQEVLAIRERNARNQALYKRRQAHKKRMEKELDLGPVATWDHNTHGFRMVGYPDPVLINDYERFMAGIKHFWSKRGLPEPLTPSIWDCVWLDWVNGRK